MAKKTPDAILEKKRDYYKRNRIKLLEKAKEHYQNNKNAILKRRKQRMADDPSYAEQQRAYHREYYKKRKACNE